MKFIIFQFLIMAQKEIIILKKIGVLIVALLEFLLHLGSLIYLIKYMNSLSAQEEYIAILAKSMGVSEETFSNDIKLIKGGKYLSISSWKMF